MPAFVRPRRLAAAGAAALALAAGVVVPAQAAPAPAWHIGRILRYCGNDGMLAVTAVGARDAWALGQPEAAPRCGADVEHWNGRAWQRVPVPRTAEFGIQLGTPPVTATSARNAWLFPVREATIGNLTFFYNYALHWNGTAWRASSFPVRLNVTAAVALRPADVWAFGTVGVPGFRQVPYAARYSGRAWHKVTPPAAAVAVSARPRAGLWAVGPTRQTAASPLRRQAFIAIRWTGRAWRTLAVPKLSVPAGPDTLQAASLVVAGPADLWWSYQAGTSQQEAAPHLLHWDGGRWQPVALPAAIAKIDDMTQDGRGGVWLTAEVDADFNSVQYWYHDQGGRWTRYPVLAPRGFYTTMSGMTWIPGTGSEWADGEADANTGSRTVGVIARYGS